MAWTTETWDPDFPRWFDSLSDYQQAVLDAAIEFVLEEYGTEICATEFGKHLGNGLYEFRVRQSLKAIRKYGGFEVSSSPGDDQTVLLRVFCHFYGDKVILLMCGLDKGKNDKAQQREIKKARKILRVFKEEQRHERKKQGRKR